ncbi:hypothetical protein SAMN05443428_1226 [Caloramator quimbayensis]|uniref:Integrase catalytic domain-containing protein n=1 Tax=Caloramator quimbayensis TaxID=1147123 RepID=A0A1T4Y4H1_9CLOT|nr:hypothetical protein [Caloramator quimbayensis]SKA96650.1 hypothetical protein SAMN05443428_1226 [Caloramator quimbayensis]
MRYEATLEEWRELYEAAIKIKEMKPWEKLWDMDLITIMPDKESEPTICSIMGKGGNFCGIGAYIGLEAIHNFFLLSQSEEMPPNQSVRYQKCILCNYGNREELTQDEYEIIKKLGYKFRGKNNWIYFKVYDPIYMPFMPDKSEVIKMTEILKQLYFALEELNDGLKVNFEDGNTLLRMFDKENNTWINKEMPVFMPEIEYKVPTLDDEVLIKRLKSKKPNKAILNLDIAYLNSVINDKKYDKPLAMRLCILSDIKNGMVLQQHVMVPEDDEINVIFNVVISYILKMGIPKTIYVRDKYMYCIIKDLCQKVGIELKISQQLPAVDFFVESFNSFRF